MQQMKTKPHRSRPKIALSPPIIVLRLIEAKMGSQKKIHWNLEFPKQTENDWANFLLVYFSAGSIHCAPYLRICASL